MTSSPLGPNPIRVAVVDDSALMRRIIMGALSTTDDIVVVATAGDAQEARALIRTEAPDVITLDVTMPGMSGLDLLEKIMLLRPMPVIMVSSSTAEGAETSITALQMGAFEVLQKPQSPEALDAFASQLQAKIRMAALSNLGRDTRVGPHGVPAGGPARSGQPVARRGLVAMGASTGGVSALGRILSELPRSMPPIVIVQHMPKGYPERFAQRLAASLGSDVAVAADGELLRPGMVRLAPGDWHLQVAARRTGFMTILSDLPPVTGHRPSVDVLFESVARSAGSGAVGVILTGMGRDGAAGLGAMYRAGAVCLAQGSRSSVVWGMPRAAVEAGSVTEVVELDGLAERICHHAAWPGGGPEPGASPDRSASLRFAERLPPGA